MYHFSEGHLYLSCRVTGLKIELLGETSIASTISYLDNAFVYVGSSYGDSQVLLNINISFSSFVNMYFQKLYLRFILFNNINSPYVVLIGWIFFIVGYDLWLCCTNMVNDQGTCFTYSRHVEIKLRKLHMDTTLHVNFIYNFTYTRRYDSNKMQMQSVHKRMWSWFPVDQSISPLQMSGCNLLDSSK